MRDNPKWCKKDLGELNESSQGAEAEGAESEIKCQLDFWTWESFQILVLVRNAKYYGLA